MAHSVFHTELQIALNLTEPDFGHPELPGLPEAIRADKASWWRGQLQCLHCMEQDPHCPQWMYLRELPDGRLVAVHYNPSREGGSHGHNAAESDLHKALKERVATVAQRDGFVADVEDRAEHGHRQTDVLIHGFDGLLLGCEIQLSYLTGETAKKRTEIAWADGITPLWTVQQRDAPLINTSPWVRIEQSDWGRIRRGGEIDLRGGLRRIQWIRCDGTTGIDCPMKRVTHKGHCGRLHGVWVVPVADDPTNPYYVAKTFDEAITLAVRGSLVPLRIPRSGNGYNGWAWVPKRDKDMYDESVAAIPKLEPRKRSSEARRPRPLSTVCTYGQDSGLRPPRREPRDTGKSTVMASMTVDELPSDPPPEEEFVQMTIDELE